MASAWADDPRDFGYELDYEFDDDEVDQMPSEVEDAELGEGVLEASWALAADHDGSATFEELAGGLDDPRFPARVALERRRLRAGRHASTAVRRPTGCAAPRRVRFRSRPRARSPSRRPEDPEPELAARVA